MSRTFSGWLRMSRSLLPRTSRFQASKRAPRKPCSSRPRAWIMVPMAPSSTRMRSLASWHSLCSLADITAAAELDSMGLDADIAPKLRRAPSPQPKSDISDFGHLRVPNSGKPEFGWGEGWGEGNNLGRSYLRSLPAHHLRFE